MSEYGPGNITALFGGQPFDPNAYEPSKDFEVLPPGKYTCLIEDAELKDTKAGTGKLIKVTLRVLGEGDYKNRKFFDNINVCNPNEECQRMGIAQLSSIARATQCYPLKDTNDLVDEVVVAVVKVKKRKDTGEDQNDIRTYENPSLAANAQHAPVAAPATVTPQPTAPTPAPAPQPAPAPVTPQPGVSPPAAAGPAGDAPWKR